MSQQPIWWEEQLTISIERLELSIEITRRNLAVLLTALDMTPEEATSTSASCFFMLDSELAAVKEILREREKSE